MAEAVPDPRRDPLRVVEGTGVGAEHHDVVGQAAPRVVERLRIAAGDHHGVPTGVQHLGGGQADSGGTAGDEGGGSGLGSCHGVLIPSRRIGRCMG